MPSFLKFNIKYIDASDQERTIEIRPQDLGINIDALNNYHIPVTYKDGRRGYYEYPYKIRDINYWFFFEAGFKNDSNSLSKSLMERLYKHKLDSCIRKTFNTQIEKSKDEEKAKLKAVKAGITYEKGYKDRYTIKKLIECSLRVNSNYLRGYHALDYGVPTNEGYDIAIPIMYADSYRYCKPQVSKDYLNMKNFQLFNYPMDLVTSKTALENAILKYISFDDKNFSKEDNEFRIKVINYISEYFFRVLNNSLNTLINDPKNGDNSYLRERVYKKITYRAFLIKTGGDQRLFIKDVLEDAGDLFLSGSYRDGSIHFYVFLSNLIAQLKAHELSKAIDLLGSRDKKLSQSNSLYRNGLFKELHFKSVQEIFNNEENRYHDEILKAVYEEEKKKKMYNQLDDIHSYHSKQEVFRGNEPVDYDEDFSKSSDVVTYQDVEDELLNMNLNYYPDLDDEDILNKIIYPDNGEIKYRK